jgi:hypothetical protein
LLSAKDPVNISYQVPSFLPPRAGTADGASGCMVQDAASAKTAPAARIVNRRSFRFLNGARPFL